MNVSSDVIDDKSRVFFAGTFNRGAAFVVFESAFGSLMSATFALRSVLRGPPSRRWIVLALRINGFDVSRCNDLLTMSPVQEAETFLMITAAETILAVADAEKFLAVTATERFLAVHGAADSAVWALGDVVTLTS